MSRAAAKPAQVTYSIHQSWPVDERGRRVRAHTAWAWNCRDREYATLDAAIKLSRRWARERGYRVEISSSTPFGNGRTTIAHTMTDALGRTWTDAESFEGASLI